MYVTTDLLDFGSCFFCLLQGSFAKILGYMVWCFVCKSILSYKNQIVTDVSDG